MLRKDLDSVPGIKGVFNTAVSLGFFGAILSIFGLAASGADVGADIPAPGFDLGL